jgi:segregation and condensation protein B
MKPSRIVEALLFASDAPLRAEEISRADESLDEDLVEDAIRTLREEYAEGERAFDIAEIAEGYQLLTRPEYAGYLERFDTVPRPARLSAAALETLGIICYRQPIGRAEVEFIRGVSSSGVIRTLMDRDLIEVAARGEGLGRPLLYGTTQRFLEHFGFNSLEDLPRPEELPVILREHTHFVEEDGRLIGVELPDDEDGEARAGTSGAEAAAGAEIDGANAVENGREAEGEAGAESDPGASGDPAGGAR